MAKSWLVLYLRPIRFSLRLDRRVLPRLLVLLLLTVVALLSSVSLGEYPVPPLAILKAVFGQEIANQDYFFIVNTLRLPRTLVAFLVGVGLAIAGAILQTITRNPLAAPSILGINAGASLAAVTLLVIFPAAPPTMLPIAAFLGALGVAIAVYLLAWNQGIMPVRLILVGVGFNFIASAMTNLMITFGEINSVSQALVWLAGSVYGRSWAHVGSLLPWILIFVGVAFVLTQPLNALSFGDDLARGLGALVEWQRGILLLTSVALAAASVATAGSIGFVGLIAPHLGRLLVGPTHEGLLPIAALLGGLLVVLADLLGRLLFAPVELPCGIVTAIIGVPYFLYLLVRKQ